MQLLLGLVLAASAAPPETLVVPLQGIVVTGTRTPQAALRIPAAISVVDRARFQNARGINLGDALGSVPGVFVQSRSGAQDVRITIRGYGARGNGERSNAGSMRGIRILTDGIPATEPDGRTALDLVDLGTADRVEVSRSNASALYGNASGGVVNLRTNLDFASPFLEVQERGGSFGFHREQTIAGFGVGESRGIVSVMNSTFHGWRAHSMSTGTLAQLRFRAPLDAITRLGVLVDATSDLNRFPGALTRAQADSAPQQANAKFVQRDDRRRNRVGRVAITVDRSIEPTQDMWLTLFVEPKVLQRSERNRFRDFTRTHAGGSAVYALRSDLTPELRSRTAVGGDEAFQDGSILFYTLNSDGSRGTTLKANKREAANSAGAFIEEELTWRERWSLNAALRFDDLRYITEDFTDPRFDATKRFTRVTPKGSLAYSTGAHTAYASLGGGVEAPAFNEIDPPPPFDTLTSFNPFLEAMRSTTYELGAKGELAGAGALGRLRYDVALYRIEVTNDIVPFDGGAYFLTAGRSRRQGVELGLDWRPSEALLVGATATISDNTYRVYQNDLGDFGGRQVAGLPKSTFTGLVRYTTPVGLSADVAVRNVGAYYADDANTARAAATTLVNGSLGYARAFGGRVLRVFVAGENLTDEQYVASVFINGVNGEYYEPGLPRNWSAGFTLRWR